MRTYDLRTAQLITEENVHPITSFSLSNDGNSIATSCLDSIIRLWGCSTNTSQMNSRKRVFRKLHSSHTSNKYKVECAFTSNDEYIVSGSEDGGVAIYLVDLTSTDSTMASANATILQRHNGPTCSVATCPQTSRPWLMVSASYDGSAVVWASQAHHDCCLMD